MHPSRLTVGGTSRTSDSLTVQITRTAPIAAPRRGTRVIMACLLLRLGTRVVPRGALNLVAQVPERVLGGARHGAQHTPDYLPRSLHAMILHPRCHWRDPFHAMRIATVIGNRPQFVKAAAVSLPLRERHEEVLIHTGQHYDDELSRIFFDELRNPAPRPPLGNHHGTNTAQTARMLAALEPELAGIAPDMVLVYGDTNSTLAGALAAAQRRVPVAHVEAGMRSFDRSMPEELNRGLTDHASDLLLCSTDTAGGKPAREGVAGDVHLVGDVMADVALAFAPVAEQISTALADHDVEPGEFLLVTAHRAGNVDDPARLERLVELLEALPLPAIFPLHPRTRARLESA